jgi:ferredoxin
MGQPTRDRELDSRGSQILSINPETCIDCDKCVPECPVSAIYAEDKVPAEWKDYIALNAEEAPNLPLILEKKDPLEGENCKPAVG